MDETEAEIIMSGTALNGSPDWNTELVLFKDGDISLEVPVIPEE